VNDGSGEMCVQEVLTYTQPVSAGASPAEPVDDKRLPRGCDEIRRRVRLGYYVKKEIQEQVLDALEKDVRAGVPAQQPEH